MRPKPVSPQQFGAQIAPAPTASATQTFSPTWIVRTTRLRRGSTRNTFSGPACEATQIDPYPEATEPTNGCPGRRTTVGLGLAAVAAAATIASSAASAKPHAPPRLLVVMRMIVVRGRCGGKLGGEERA